MQSNNDLKGLACDATKYPELFKYLPWGSFMLEHTKHLINAEVIENRNTFVEQLGITQVTSKSLQYAGIHTERV